MRVVVITGQPLDAQARLFIGAIRRAAELVGIVRVRARPRKTGRLGRYARMARQRGIGATANFLAGLPISAIVRPSIHRRVEAILRQHVHGDPTEGITVADGGLVNSSEELDALRRFAPELLYQAGPGIARPAVFRAAPLGMLHVHHGILPAIRGIASPEWAVREARPLWLGVTLHLIDAGLDTGPLVAQGRPRVEAGDSWARVRAKLSLLGARLIAEGLRALQAGLRPVPQPQGLPSSYRSNLGLTDWALFAARLRPFLRSCYGREEQTSIGEFLPQ